MCASKECDTGCLIGIVAVGVIVNILVILGLLYLFWRMKIRKWFLDIRTNMHVERDAGIFSRNERTRMCPNAGRERITSPECTATHVTETSDSSPRQGRNRNESGTMTLETGTQPNRKVEVNLMATDETVREERRTIDHSPPPKPVIYLFAKTPDRVRRDIITKELQGEFDIQDWQDDDDGPPSQTDVILVYNVKLGRPEVSIVNSIKDTPGQPRYKVLVLFSDHPQTMPSSTYDVDGQRYEGVSYVAHLMYSSRYKELWSSRKTRETLQDLRDRLKQLTRSSKKAKVG